MSMERTRYVGPYLHCKIPFKRERQLTSKECRTTGCTGQGEKRSLSWKNCPMCGQALDEWYEHVNVNPVDWFEDAGEDQLFEQKSHRNGFVVLMPNTREVPRWKCKADGKMDDGGYILRLSEDTITQDKLDFMEHYREAIEKARELYGSDAVELVWGIVEYIT